VNIPFPSPRVIESLDYRVAYTARCSHREEAMIIHLRKERVVPADFAGNANARGAGGGLVIPSRMPSSETRGVRAIIDRGCGRVQSRSAQRDLDRRLSRIEAANAKGSRVVTAAITTSPGSPVSFTRDRRLPVAADGMVSGIKISLRGSRSAQVQVRTTTSRCQRRKICLRTSRT